MDATEAEKQIYQMCRFIEQEAKEKVEEITMKTDQDHDKEEQTLLVEGRIALKAEFEKKLKELSVRKRMCVGFGTQLAAAYPSVARLYFSLWWLVLRRRQRLLLRAAACCGPARPRLKHALGCQLHRPVLANAPDGRHH
jgi:hypothetical protein